MRFKSFNRPNKIFYVYSIVFIPFFLQVFSNWVAHTGLVLVINILSYNCADFWFLWANGDNSSLSKLITRNDFSQYLIISLD